MKKKLLLAGMVCIALISSACGKKSLPSDTAISCAEQTIEVTNDYLDGKTDYDSAKASLDELSQQMSYVTEDSDEKDNPNHSEDLYVQIRISSIKTGIISYNMKNDSDSKEKIQEDVKELEELIGK